MKISIEVEKGVIPDDDFFTRIHEIISNHAWYLDNGDSRIIGNIEISRSYSTIEITQINEDDSNGDN